MRPKLVFTGPTLSHAEASAAIDAICLPPAVQGSVVAAVQRFDPSSILVIDGGFQAEPAVRHKEILWAISLGIPVVGAASMGALRAAELYPHMLGVGLIYRWYRRFAFAPDDAVAVLHGPGEVNFAALTHALVDLRLTIRAAWRRGLISRDISGKLESAARRLNFRDRTLAQIVREALVEDDDGALERYETLLASVFVQQKKRDALEALQLLRENTLTQTMSIGFRMTAAFARDLEDAGLQI